MKKREFVTKAATLKLKLDGQTIVGMPREFSTGSSGWSFNGKLDVILPDGTEARIQFSGNGVVIGSKEWED